MITENIRNAILEQKKRRGMTYDEIAEKSGVSVHTIYNYMYRNNGISTALAESILNALGMRIKIVPKDGGRNG